MKIILWVPLNILWVNLPNRNLHARQYPTHKSSYPILDTHTPAPNPRTPDPDLQNLEPRFQNCEAWLQIIRLSPGATLWRDLRLGTGFWQSPTRKVVGIRSFETRLRGDKHSQTGSYTPTEESMDLGGPGLFGRGSTWIHFRQKRSNIENIHNFTN